MNEISSSIESARQRDSIREISLEIFEEISELQKVNESNTPFMSNTHHWLDIQLIFNAISSFKMYTSHD